MTRNAGEAMGVAAAANFRDLDDDERLFTSTVDVVSLYEMESLLRGERPFGGLTAPDWPEDVLGPIDPGLAEEGEDLYRQHCQWCHLPPINDSTFFADANWTPEDDFGNRYIKAKMVNLYDIGTDPNQATNFARRVVQLDELGRKFADRGAIGGLGIGGTLTAGAALPLLVRKTKEKRYDDLDVPDSLRVLYDGLREDSVRAPLAYKARPLDGIWATAPYLHNGAVPNLYQLLSPVAERDTMFYLGSKEFDPDNVGFVTDPISGGFELDTSLSGNSNEGHEFRGDTVPEQ